MPLRCLNAALHVAAATGRAEVVRQLAAAGASVDKPLPMDYRALLKQSAQQQQPAVAAAAAAAPAGGSSERGEAIAAEPCSPECEEAATGDTLGLEGEGDGADWLEGRAPPPKRGRYVTAGPSGPGRPSLQYCTALHLAALQGQLEVVQALLATGQVRAACLTSRCCCCECLHAAVLTAALLAPCHSATSIARA